MQKVELSDQTDHSACTRQEVSRGLLYAHSRLNANARKTREATAYLYALIELLDEKGLVAPAELEPRREAFAQRLAEQVKQEGNGVAFQDPEQDKYAFDEGTEIDCATRLHFCKAACCRLPFALSRQDVREGIIRWELGSPYLIEHEQDGYCAHMDRGDCTCTIYSHRPVPCRGFDCREDGRIWLDYEQMIPNPAIEQSDWPYSLAEADDPGENP